MYHSSVDDDYCVAVYLFYVAMQVPIVRDQVESKSTHKSWTKSDAKTLVDYRLFFILHTVSFVKRDFAAPRE